MAEIKVEQKRSGLGLLWAIIIIAIAAAAIWYFTHANRAVPTTTPADSTRTSLVSPPRADHAVNAAVLRYLEGATNG